MNILYITNHLNVGGITTYVLSLAKGMKLKGHNVYVASSGGELLTKFIESGIVYIPIPIRTKQELSPKIIFSMFKLAHLIRKNNIELLHTHSRTTSVLASLLNKFVSIKHISTCHGFFKPRLSRKIFPCWGKKVIAISEAVKEHLIHDLRVDEKNIVVIHNGIDLNKFKIQNSKFKTEIKRVLGLQAGPVIGIVARLSDVKGHIYLIEAMQIVLESMASTQLLIVGEGKMREELVKLVKQLGIKRSVFFIPEAKDTHEVLSIMDLFVMPSLKEGLGLALMEAMASGLAVIGSDVGGITTLIQHEVNGLLVKPADKQGLALAILELLKDEQKRYFLARNAQSFICQNFSLEKMLQQTEKVYLDSLCAKD